MSLLMWAHGEQSLAKSLVACKLYKAMAHEAAEDDLDTEIYDELKQYAKDFESKGIKLLDFCYRQDAERAQRLLTCELQSWSNQSCLSLAVSANHRPLLAHPCSQIILADLWMGGLRTRKNTNLKVSVSAARNGKVFVIYYLPTPMDRFEGQTTDEFIGFRLRFSFIHSCTSFGRETMNYCFPDTFIRLSMIYDYNFNSFAGHSRSIIPTFHQEARLQVERGATVDAAD